MKCAYQLLDQTLTSLSEMEGGWNMKKIYSFEWSLRLFLNSNVLLHSDSIRCIYMLTFRAGVPWWFATFKITKYNINSICRMENYKATS